MFAETLLFSRRFAKEQPLSLSPTAADHLGAWAAATESHAVHGAAGAAISLPLTANPATGLCWELDLPQGVLRLEDVADPVFEHHVDGAVRRQIRVQALAGDYHLIARLAHPWDKEHPVRVAEVRLRVRSA